MENSKAWCEHYDRLNFCTAKGWLHDAWLLSWETGEGKLQTDIGNVDLRVVFFILALRGNITIWHFRVKSAKFERYRRYRSNFALNYRELSCHLVVFYGGHLTFDVIESDSEIFYAKSVFQTSIIYNPAYWQLLASWVNSWGLTVDFFKHCSNDSNFRLIIFACRKKPMVKCSNSYVKDMYRRHFKNVFHWFFSFHILLFRFILSWINFSHFSVFGSVIC